MYIKIYIYKMASKNETILKTLSKLKGKKIVDKTTTTSNSKSKDNYDRPIKTYTDNLTTEQIKEKLKDYIQVETQDIDTIIIGTHMRYFVDEDGKKKFRMGGNLINIKGYPDYVILGNGTQTWSVQLANTIWFKRIDVVDLNNLKKQYEDKLIEQKEEITKLKKIISGLKDNNKKK